MRKIFNFLIQKYIINIQKKISNLLLNLIELEIYLK